MGPGWNILWDEVLQSHIHSTFKSAQGLMEKAPVPGRPKNSLWGTRTKSADENCWSQNAASFEENVGTRLFLTGEKFSPPPTLRNLI